MRTLWLIIRHDLGVTFRQRSFWILTFLMPGLLLLMNSYAILADSGGLDGGRDDSSESEEAALPTVGLVDNAGLVDRIPSTIPPKLFQRFADADQALAALEDGEIEQYALIPADYLERGEVIIYDEGFKIQTGGADSGVAFGAANEALLQYVIRANLTGDENLALAMGNPLPGHLVERHAVLDEAGEEVGDEALAELVASVTPYIFYFILLIGSGYLMRAVVAEKENRTVEVLLLSVSPRRLMLGKILAMSLVTILQAVVWIGGGYLILNRGAQTLNVPPFEYPPGFFLWFVPFLILGFLLYASFMAAAGALAPNAREGNQMTWLLIVPLMPTLLFAREFLTDPHGTLAVALSLFPFSAPSAMVTRLAVAPDVPLWQPLLSLGGLALTTYVIVLLAARFFRPGTLLSDASFSWRRLATGWRVDQG